MQDVVIPLLTGLAGIFAGGLIQIRGRRLEQLRERQIVAADDFAQAATEVFVALGSRMEQLGDPAGRVAEWVAGFVEAADEARANMHETTRRLPRLEIVFGVGAPTATAAAESVGHLHRMTSELRGRGRPNVVLREYELAIEEFGRFTARAGEIVRWPAWRHWLKPAQQVATDQSRSIARLLGRTESDNGAPDPRN